MRVPFPDGLSARLAGRRIENFGRRAKHLLFVIEGSGIMTVHLGMSGRLRIFSPGENAAPERHDHMIVAFGDGGRLVLNDPRRFGMVLLFASVEEMGAHPSFAGLGPEPLEDGFDGSLLESRLASRAGPVKAALLDQRVVAGVGNIYACEALHRAGISPFRESRSVSGDEARALADSIRAVLEDAIAAGGSSLRDYRRADGEMGYFQHHFSVYGRTGQACPGCSCDVMMSGGIRRTVQGGRSTFHCPEKQPAEGVGG